MLLVEASSNQVRQKNEPPLSAKTVKQHHMKFVEFCCLDMCPFDVVSSKGFVKEAQSETLVQVFKVKKITGLFELDKFISASGIR